MSLKFGIYLVEQRIISPEQFCGLVKIQQEATKALPTLAVEKNFLTIKQVATILDVKEITPSKGFEQIAVELDYLDANDAAQLIQVQQMSCPTVQKLVVECGLLTQRQAAVLAHHYDKAPAPAPAPAAPQQQPQTAPQQVPATQAPRSVKPRQPKFKQRPVIVHPYASSNREF